MNVQYQQEHQVTETIDKYHQQAMQARQVRLAQGEQPGRFVTITMSVRAAITSVGARFHRVPAVAQEPIAAPTPTDAPVESVATA